MFNGTHYGKKMARLAIAGFSANVGNVRYTDHSIEQTPSAGMADEKPVEISQPTVASSAKGDTGLEATHWPMYIQDQTLDTRRRKRSLLSLRVRAPERSGLMHFLKNPGQFI